MPSPSKLPCERTIPPRDSWIQLAPGASVQIDERLGQQWSKLTVQCREIRGNVLAKCFEIEYLIDLVIAETLIPASTNNQDGQQMFKDLLLKGPTISFRTKIELLRKLCHQVNRLKPLLPKNIFADLNSIRELRNDFAHYPVAFEPTGDPPDQTLLPLLVSRRGRFVLDDAFLKQYSQVFASTHTMLGNTFKALLKPDETATPGGMATPQGSP